MSASGYDVNLLRKAREVIALSMNTKAAEVANGISKGDQFDYGKRCGQIQGMRDALAIMEEIAKDLMGEERKE